MSLREFTKNTVHRDPGQRPGVSAGRLQASHVVQADTWAAGASWPCSLHVGPQAGTTFPPSLHPSPFASCAISLPSAPKSVFRSAQETGPSAFSGTGQKQVPRSAGFKSGLLLD